MDIDEIRAHVLEKHLRITEYNLAPVSVPPPRKAVKAEKDDTEDDESAENQEGDENDDASAASAAADGVSGPKKRLKRGKKRKKERKWRKWNISNRIIYNKKLLSYLPISLSCKTM